jgi:NAD(P)-dependent dehydrogenase (short-subunit alcohol dehydrogenase family)
LWERPSGGFSRPGGWRPTPQPKSLSRSDVGATRVAGLIDTQIARDVVSGDEKAYTEMIKQVPIGRAGRPEEIASAVPWLRSPGARYVVGHALTVDGGMTVV